MNEQPRTTNRHSDGVTSAGHDDHDLILIAALAAGDLDGRERSTAERLASDCTECDSLLADLRSIAEATRTLPARPRPAGLDFRLTQDDARRLGARGWRRALQELASARFGFTRPLAVGLTTLGLVGVISASIPGAIGSGSPSVLSNVGAPVTIAQGPAAESAGAAAPTEQDRNSGGLGGGQPATNPSMVPGATAAPTFAAASSAPQPSATGVAVASVPPHDSNASPGPSASDGTFGTAFGGSSGSPKTGIGAGGEGSDQTGGTNAQLQARPEGPSPSPILILSILAVVTGILLLIGQWVGDRLLTR
jgi:hypothetical protein